MTGPRRHPVISFAGHLALGCAALLTLLPFLWLLIASLKTDTFTHMFLPPVAEWGREITTANYLRLFRETAFFRYGLNSAFLATASTLVAMLGCTMGGFALAKYRFAGQKVLMAVMLASMMLPGEVLLGPMFELIYYLNWMDTYWALIVPGMAPVFGIFLFRQAFKNMPDELLEAARIDGAGEFTLWWKIAIPQVRPMVGAFSLLTFLGSWNSYLWPQIVLRTQEKLPLPVALAQLRSVYATDYGLIMAGTVMSILPVVIVFFLFQKDFVSGLTKGAIK